MDSKKHSGIITLFNEKYIKPGLVEEKNKDILTKAFYIRIDSDYKDFYLASQNDAEEQITNAEYFLNRIVNFIQQHYKINV